MAKIQLAQAPAATTAVLPKLWKTIGGGWCATDKKNRPLISLQCTNSKNNISGLAIIDKAGNIIDTTDRLVMRQNNKRQGTNPNTGKPYNDPDYQVCWPE